MSVAAGANLAAVAYTWSHPKDGAQEGLLDDRAGRGGGPAGGAVGRLLAPGTPRAGRWPVPSRAASARVGASYGGDWQWNIIVDASDPASLRIRMDNVVPESAGADGHFVGAYWAMDADLRREA